MFIDEAESKLWDAIYSAILTEAFVGAIDDPVLVIKGVAATADHAGSTILP